MTIDNNSPFANLVNMTPTCRHVYSSRLEWEVFPHDSYTEFCADGDGFVCVQDHMTYFLLLDQGEVIARLPNGYLIDTLEHAQQYLAATYPAVFKLWDTNQ